MYRMNGVFEEDMFQRLSKKGTKKRKKLLSVEWSKEIKKYFMHKIKRMHGITFFEHKKKHGQRKENKEKL